MCGRCEMIYTDAHVRYGQSCCGQSSVESHNTEALTPKKNKETSMKRK